MISRVAGFPPRRRYARTDPVKASNLPNVSQLKRTSILLICFFLSGIKRTEVLSVLRERRQQEILEELERSGSVLVASLSRSLGVSDMTVRRDLEELSARNLLRKVHGGAGPGPEAGAESPFRPKKKAHPTGKRARARAGLGLS